MRAHTFGEGKHDGALLESAAALREHHVGVHRQPGELEHASGSFARLVPLCKAAPPQERLPAAWQVLLVVEDTCLVWGRVGKAFSDRLLPLKNLALTSRSMCAPNALLFKHATCTHLLATDSPRNETVTLPHHALARRQSDV